MNFVPRNIAPARAVEEAAEQAWREACAAYLAACFCGAPDETILRKAQAMYEARVDLWEAEAMALAPMPPIRSSSVSVKRTKKAKTDGK